MNAKLKMRQYFKMAAQNIVLPLFYMVCSIRPVDKGLIVFADAHHHRCPDNLKPVLRALRKEQESGADIRIREMYLDYQDASFGSVLRHMLSFMACYAHAGTVVICDNFLPAAGCRKRKGTRVVQLWHACGALKKFGYDAADDIPEGYRGNVYKNTDLVTVSAEVCRQPFASAMGLPLENVQALGAARTDRYFSEKWKAAARKRFYDAYPEAEDKKVLVWAPTFRGNAGDPKSIPLDLQKLQQQLGNSWFVLASLHPHVAEKIRTGKGGADIGNISPGRISTLPTEQLFPVADALIADYSSLIYEYLLFGKPLILYVPDLEEYKSGRGFYQDFDEIPGVQVLREEELSEAVRKCAEEAGRAAGAESAVDIDSAADADGTAGAESAADADGTVEACVNAGSERREQFLRRYMSACDGHATERIVSWILKK